MTAARGLRIVSSVALVLALGAAGAALVPRPQAVAAPTTINAGIQPATTTPNVYPIVHIMDGDTFAVLMDGSTTTIRIIGMDTPEVVDPRKPVQCFGPQASAEAHKLLDGQYVRLAYEPNGDVLDKYGRTLAYVFLMDGTSYEEFMIENGFAHEYTYDKKYEYQAEFRAAQAQAKQAQLGFWSPETCAGNTTKPAAS